VDDADRFVPVGETSFSVVCGLVVGTDWLDFTTGRCAGQPQATNIHTPLS